MATRMFNGTPRPIPATRVFTQAAWSWILAGLTFEDWKRAGGIGMSHQVEHELCRMLKLNARRLAGVQLIELVTYGWAGRVLERQMACFAADDASQLKFGLHALAGMVAWEHDQNTGELLYPLPQEPGQ